MVAVGDEKTLALCQVHFLILNSTGTKRNHIFGSRNVLRGVGFCFFLLFPFVEDDDPIPQGRGIVGLDWILQYIC